MNHSSDQISNHGEKEERKNQVKENSSIDSAGQPIQKRIWRTIKIQKKKKW